MYTNMCAHISAHAWIDIYTHSCTHTHTRARARTHAHTHTRARALTQATIGTGTTRLAPQPNPAPTAGSAAAFAGVCGVLRYLRALWGTTGVLWCTVGHCGVLPYSQGTHRGKQTRGRRARSTAASLRRAPARTTVPCGTAVLRVRTGTERCAAQLHHCDAHLRR